MIDRLGAWLIRALRGPSPGDRFRVAVADLYAASRYGAVLGFEVTDRDGRVLGRFEGVVRIMDGATPERFVARARDA